MVSVMSDIDVEVVILRDAEIKKLIEKHLGKRRITYIVNAVLDELNTKGYCVSEDKVRKLVHEVLREKGLR